MVAPYLSPRARADVLRCEQLDGTRRMAVRRRVVGSRPRWRAGVIRPVGGGVGTVEAFLETSCVVARLALATSPFLPRGLRPHARHERNYALRFSRGSACSRGEIGRGRPRRSSTPLKTNKRRRTRAKERKRKETRDRQLSSLRLRLLRFRGSRTLRQMATSLRSPRWLGVGPCAKLCSCE